MIVKAPMQTGIPGSDLIKTYYELHHQKQLYRQGWLRVGIAPAQCESVADHSQGLLLLCLLLLLEPEYHRLDALKVVSLAAVHDSGEPYAGDWIPGQLSLADKHVRERAAIERIFGKLPGGQRYIELWQEYEAGQSPEAAFVRQVDRLEMALQAAVYHRQLGVAVAEFFASARQVVKDPRLAAILAEIEAAGEGG